MALMVIKERSTGMYLAAEFREVAFVDAERVPGQNNGTWLSTLDDEHSVIIASASNDDRFEVLDVVGWQP